MTDSSDSHDPSAPLEAEWDREKVYALFDDLQQAAVAKQAEIHHVQVRTSSPSTAKDCQATLEEARRLLDSGEARAIQIRYSFDDESWCDTLMVFPDVIRVIRTRGVPG
jgi:hypothetical protein